MRVVRGDDQDVGRPELPGLPCRPGAEVELDALDAGPEQLVNESSDRRGFLVGGVPTVIVRHLDEAKSGAVKRARADDALTLEPGQRLQPALVERLGGEVADRRRKTPGGRQEHSAIGGNGLVTAEKMLERRSIRRRPGDWPVAADRAAADRRGARRPALPRSLPAHWPATSARPRRRTGRPPTACSSSRAHNHAVPPSRRPPAGCRNATASSFSRSSTIGEPSTGITAPSSHR